MAGRGRGRGKTVSFDVQALGFGRGEALPAAILQPPPLFPTQEFKPVPLVKDEDLEYMLALKQEFAGTLRKSPYYLKLDEKKRDIERYSDKYQLNQQDSGEKFVPDWSRFPSELKTKVKKTRKVKSAVQPNIPVRRKKPSEAGGVEADITKTLEGLEKKEEQSVDNEKSGVKGESLEKKEEQSGDVEEGGVKEEGEEDKEDEDEEGVNLEEEEYDEEDLEEETDYGVSYFDNGEGYGDDDGDDDEGPVY